MLDFLAIQRCGDKPAVESVGLPPPAGWPATGAVELEDVVRRGAWTPVAFDHFGHTHCSEPFSSL